MSSKTKLRNLIKLAPIVMLWIRGFLGLRLRLHLRLESILILHLFLERLSQNLHISLTLALHQLLATQCRVLLRILEEVVLATKLRCTKNVNIDRERA